VGEAEAGAVCWLINTVAAGVVEVNVACWLAGVAEADAACWLINSVKAEAKPGLEARSMDRMEVWLIVGMPVGV